MGIISRGTFFGKLQEWVMARPSPSHAGIPALVAIGQAIRSLRADLGYSQESLAYDAGIDRSYMGGIEREEHNLTLMSLIRICGCLRVSASEVLRRSGW